MKWGLIIIIVLIGVVIIKGCSEVEPWCFKTRGMWSGEDHCNSLCSDSNRDLYGNNYYPTNNISYSKDQKYFNCSCESGKFIEKVYRSCI